MQSMLGVSTFHPSLHSSIRICALKLPHVPFPPSNTVSSGRFLSIRAMIHDAAQPIQSKLAQHSHEAHPLRIAIVGFGKFGQFLARTLVRQGHTVLAYNRSDCADVARKLGVTFFPNLHDLCEEQPEVVLLSTSIISFKDVLSTLPLQRLKRSTLFVDVLSVKEFPKNLILQTLPSDFDILCTHPLFGPESATAGWSGHPFMFQKVRIGNEEHRIAVCDKFLDVFRREGCDMLEMSCEDHDKYSAETQFITHFIGRVLGMMELESTPINTTGYESLLKLVETAVKDSLDLLYGLFLYNKNSLEILERLDLAFKDLMKQLMGRLHAAVREQKFDKYQVMENAPNELASVVSSNDQRFDDVAKLSKYKSNDSSKSDDNSKLKIAIVGFGRFGQFLAKTILHHGHEVLAYNRSESDYSHVAWDLGVSYINEIDDLCEQHPEVILFCTSIISTEEVLRSFPYQRLKRSTLLVDVLSVKEFPRNWFLQYLPPDFDILCTHPMFGPDSAKDGWNGLNFVFDKVRIGRDESRASRCDRIIDIFKSEGCQLVEMSCAEHDRHAAGSQFITHTVGRLLEKLKLEPTKIDTMGYKSLLSLVDKTIRDSFDLYFGLFLHNRNAMQQLNIFYGAFHKLKTELNNRLHDDYQQQVLKHADLPEVYVARDI